MLIHVDLPRPDSPVNDETGRQVTENAQGKRRKQRRTDDHQREVRAVLRDELVPLVGQASVGDQRT